MIAGTDWLIMCWHNAVKLLPTGEATDAASTLRAEVMRTVWSRWMDSGTTAADLAALISLEMMATHEAAQREIATWLEVWEAEFADASQARATDVESAPVETETLSAERRAVREFRKRLQAQESSPHSALDRTWLPSITLSGAEDEMKSLTAQASRRLDAIVQSLRGATEVPTIGQVREQLQIAHRAQRQADEARVAAKREQEATERFQMS